MLCCLLALCVPLRLCDAIRWTRRCRHYKSENLDGVNEKQDEQRRIERNEKTTNAKTRVTVKVDARARPIFFEWGPSKGVTRIESCWDFCKNKLIGIELNYYIL